MRMLKIINKISNTRVKEIPLILLKFIVFIFMSAIIGVFELIIFCLFIYFANLIIFSNEDYLIMQIGLLALFFVFGCLSFWKLTKLKMEIIS